MTIRIICYGLGQQYQDFLKAVDYKMEMIWHMTKKRIF